jgi:hypothetical protein
MKPDRRSVRSAIPSGPVSELAEASFAVEGRDDALSEQRVKLEHLPVAIGHDEHAPVMIEPKAPMRVHDIIADLHAERPIGSGIAQIGREGPEHGRPFRGEIGPEAVSRRSAPAMATIPEFQPGTTAVGSV